MTIYRYRQNKTNEQCHSLRTKTFSLLFQYIEALQESNKVRRITKMEQETFRVNREENEKENKQICIHAPRIGTNFTFTDFQHIM